MDALKKLDLFPKTIDDFRVKTATGGILSLLSISLMLILFIAELRSFYTPEVIDHLYVNTTRSEHFKVNFDISFPVIPCNLLSLDAYDDVGEPQKDIVQHVYKHKLDKDGKKDSNAVMVPNQIGQTIRSEKDLEEMHKKLGLEINPADEEEVKDPCGNCYGAGDEGQCCHTCDDVRKAYDRLGWLFRPQDVKQCKKEITIQTMKDAFSEDGGCQIYGMIELKRASGHFHIAPHKDIHTTGINSGFVNLLDLISLTFAQFNITHTINSLSFGENFPGIKSPLDGQKRTVEDVHGMYQYYLKIVPSKYVSGKGGCIKIDQQRGKKNVCRKEIESNQYSVTEHLRHLAPNSGRGLPGVYFNYEISPVQAVFTEKKKTLISFITTVCAIVGGVYTVMGMLDNGYRIASKLILNDGVIS